MFRVCMCALINTGSFLYTVSLQDSLQNKVISLVSSDFLAWWNFFAYCVCMTNDAIRFLISLVDNKYIF